MMQQINYCSWINGYKYTGCLHWKVTEIYCVRTGIDQAHTFLSSVDRNNPDKMRIASEHRTPDADVIDAT